MTEVHESDPTRPSSSPGRELTTLPSTPKYPPPSPAMDPVIPYTTLLQSIITSSSPPSDIPSLSALISLQAHIDALRQAARIRLSSLRTGKERVDVLRQRDIQKDRVIAAVREQERKDEKDRDKLKKQQEKERQRRETEREDRERERLAQLEEQRHNTSGKGATSGGGKSGSSSSGKGAAVVKEEQDPIDSIPTTSTSTLPPPPPPPSAAAGSDGDSDDSSVALTHRKKKKRKHGLITSDNESERAGRAGSEEASRHRSRDRSVSISIAPAPLPAAGIVRPKIKLFTSRRSSSPLPTAPAYSAPSNIDFNLATGSRSLVPPRPPVPAPPVPGPMNQADVNEDYSNVKVPPNQVLFGTFWQGIEPYVRQIGEEDLAFLKQYKDEDTEPYVLPPLGKPYQQVWDEEDRLIAQSLPVPIISSTSPYRPNPNGGPVNKSLDYPRMSRKEFEYDSRELKEEDLVVEDKGAGPLTERVVSALLAAREEADAPIGFLPPASGEGSSSGGASGAKGMQVDQAAGQVGEGAWGGPLDPGPERLGMGDMEARMRKELQAVGLLGEEEIDWSLRADDEISTSLRQTQRLLASQTELNTTRRSTLLSIAQDRLAYAEYLQCLEGLDRIIDSGWHKRQRLIQRQQKRRETTKGGGLAGSREREKEEKEKEQNKKLGEALKVAIGRRKKFVEFVGGVFKRAEEGEEVQGRFWGLPKESVYRERAGAGEGQGEAIGGGGGGAGTEEAEEVAEEAEVEAMEGVEGEKREEEVLVAA